MLLLFLFLLGNCFTSFTSGNRITILKAYKKYAIESLVCPAIATDALIREGSCTLMSLNSLNPNSFLWISSLYYSFFARNCQTKFLIIGFWQKDEKL